MKKSLFITHLIALALIYSSASYASGGEGRGHGKEHRNHHHSEEARYYPEQPQRQNYQDPRSHQGLGAAAGSYLGNGVAGRRNSD